MQLFLARHFPENKVEQNILFSNNARQYLYQNRNQMEKKKKKTKLATHRFLEKRTPKKEPPPKNHRILFFDKKQMKLLTSTPIRPSTAVRPHPSDPLHPQCCYRPRQVLLGDNNCPRPRRTQITHLDSPTIKISPPTGPSDEPPRNPTHDPGAVHRKPSQV